MLRVSSHYTAIVNNTPPPLADTASMADIAELDVAYRASDKFRADREYWSQRLADLPELATLTRRSSPAAPLSTIRSAVLDDDLVTRIRVLAREHRVRPASVITAAVADYGVLIGRTTAPEPSPSATAVGGGSRRSSRSSRPVTRPSPPKPWRTATGRSRSSPPRRSAAR
ncbi:hypothetical protein MTX80_08555 [Gordonia amicalis]|nr:hypothetical protein [Gordonia amicalis]UOG22935.1 hypothetical protein MTX80_08555 [Gordonia amicalis]